LVKFVGEEEEDVAAAAASPVKKEEGAEVDLKKEEGAVVDLKKEEGVVAKSEEEQQPAATTTVPTADKTDAASETVANGGAVPSNVISSSAPAPPPPAPVPTMDSHLRNQLLSLENYVANLHKTELTLRQALMKAIDKKQGSKGGDGGAETLLQLSTLAVAMAADEVEGTADAEDWRFFVKKEKKGGQNGAAEKEDDEDDSDSDDGAEEIQWSNKVTDHALLGKVIYRPQSSPLRPAATQGGDDGNNLNDNCYWYRVVHYTPSIKAVEEVTSEGATTSSENIDAAAASAQQRPNTIVERRMRFRAVPVAESDIDAPPSGIEEMDIDDEDVEYMILTEAQARAGMEAAALHRMMEGKQKKKNGSSKKEDASPRTVAAVHPYRNGHGSRVMLTPEPEGAAKDGGDGKEFEVLYGVIAGYTTTSTAAHSAGNNEGVQHKLLVLLEDDDHEGNGAKEDDGNDSNTKLKSCAFWSTVDSDGTFLTDIVPENSSSSKNGGDAPAVTIPILCSRYSIEMHEFYQGSPAYNVCESIITYLKNHSKSGPFLQPVDPIALGIPEYPSVIKNPMDISTLEKNLKEGKYSRIPPQTSAGADEEDGTDTPVYRMAYGPFFDAAMLIFDNCIQFNGATSWIGNEAAIFKKNAMKKIEQLVSRAVWSGQGGMSAKTSSHGGGGGGAGASSRRAATKSMYTEEDSDVDMYEYESDYEDDDGGGKRRSRNARGNRAKTKKGRGKEDIVSKAIEQPFMMPENAHEFGTGGAFPHLKIQTNVGKFSLSQEWSCRYIQEGPSAGGGSDGKEEEEKDKEEDEDEMLMLLQMQQEEDAGTVRRSTRARHAPKNYADEEVAENPTTRSYAPQAPITLPGVEYYLVNGDDLQPKRKVAQEDGKEGINGESKADTDSDSLIPTICRSRLGAEGVQETIHERFYAKLYREHSPNALILDSGIGKYVGGSFPPYLGRVVPSTDEAMVWEIREQYLIPALRWVLRGLVQSGHLEEVDGSLSEGLLDDAHARTSFGSGIVVPSHEYYYNETSPPFDVLDEKEILRKRRQDAAAADSDSSSEEEVEMSEYEQMRAARVARNAERLKALGLA